MSDPYVHEFFDGKNEADTTETPAESEAEKPYLTASQAERDRRNERDAERYINAANELTPCPFCGSLNIKPVDYPSSSEYWHECKGCGASTGIYDSEIAARAGWNRRV